ncbi:hypothetical protein BHE97_07050 [Aeromicrobium sp. PE09-221]|uniref:hypothetical protein n=1 Tax=Aeromicrobium sp. PE09-221 TaxID=1898043 RepID=UPI000B3EB4FA|nr:hypothetical protein [Aeromicrobium sp. PE09-221]OUZ10510.1 hypothetical protein BHE97_07050 [Aeromicrobium sp. PE09-221]
MAARTSAFLAFRGDLAGDFDRFLGFSRGPLYVATEDLATLQAGLAELLAPYLPDPDDDRRRLSLATILIPEVDAP